MLNNSLLVSTLFGTVRLHPRVPNSVEISNSVFNLYVLLWQACCLCFFWVLRMGEVVVRSDMQYGPEVHLNYQDVKLNDRSQPQWLEVHIKLPKQVHSTKVCPFILRPQKDHSAQLKPCQCTLFNGGQGEVHSSHLRMASTSPEHDSWQHFKSLFVSKGNSLGRTSTVKLGIKVSKHNIKAPPTCQAQRRLHVALNSVVPQEVMTVLKQKEAQLSSSPQASPVVLVWKKDGALQFCVDFYQLNAITHRDIYQLPRINETLDSLSNSKFFTTVDLHGLWILTS